MLDAPTVLKLVAVLFTFHNCDCPDPTVTVWPEEYPKKRLSKTSSLPLGVGTSIVAVVCWVVPLPALTAVPSGFAWSTPEKFTAPATIPLDTFPEKVIVRVPVTPLGGLTYL